MQGGVRGLVLENTTSFLGATAGASPGKACEKAPIIEEESTNGGLRKIVLVGVNDCLPGPPLSSKNHAFSFLKNKLVCFIKALSHLWMKRVTETVEAEVVF